MGLCVNESTKRKRAYKTIIIPKGIIDPNNTNVIEIPLNYETNSSLVVKAPTDSNSCFTVEPYRNEYSHNPASFIQGRVQEPQEFQQPRLQFSVPPTPKHNFSVQTQEPVIPRPRPRRKVHSPLCPICNRPSCKFSFDTYQTTSPNTSYRLSDYLTDTKNETIYPDERKREDLLRSVVEEKVERILKPVVAQLTSTILQDEEQERSYRRQNLDSQHSEFHRSNNSRNYSIPGSSYKDFTQGIPRFKPETSSTPTGNFSGCNRSRKTVRTEDNNKLRNVDSRFSCSSETSWQQRYSQDINTLDSTFGPMNENQRNSFDSLPKSSNFNLTNKD